MINLPEKPAPATVTPAFIDYGRVIRGSLGGKDQRIDRPGSRWRLGVNMPPLNSQEDSQKYVARLIRGKSEGCRIEWPLGAFKPGNPGRPVIAIDDPTGELLPLTGFAPHYIIREGQFFSIENEDGQHFLHVAQDEVAVGADGAVALKVFPHLRAPFPSGSVCHFEKPMIEGFVETGDELQWQMAVDYNVGLSFTIREAE